MDVRYIDAHCHLQFDTYDADRDVVAEQMREQGVAGITIGCDFDSSKKAVALAEKHEHVFASVGVHPNHTDEPFDEAALRSLAVHQKVVAIGECGLDYFRPTIVDDAEKARQKELFKKQVEIAAELDKSLVIHGRPSKGTQDAYHDVFAVLKEAKEKYPKLRGDMHFFVGGVAEAEMFIGLDFTLSFTAVITFARDYDAVIKTVPLTSILAETDAPYVAPVSRRGERNDPLAVIDVVAKIAEIRAEDPETVRLALLANTRRMFGLTVANA
ncbi:MAG: TatD family hydrolase [Minisyncoccia bacterium]